ncbi:Alpha-crystallin B chain like protein [Argiope bruennichi]|uniref:Alpha-crystallin B chain like protein n=1 Tax=Argiope bruennichi TaxID=94029 RepID=A0A8T0E778_ARGBR|nr:Alpha-crystallin B chain like protein [Argiope bruennichi]
MDPKCTRLLKGLREYIDVAEEEYMNKVYPKSIRELDSKVLAEIAATAAGDMAKTSIRLLKKLEKAGKTSRNIDQRYANIYDAISSTDENKIAEALQEQEISEFASTKKDKDVKCVKEQTFSKFESSDEEKIVEIVQEQEFSRRARLSSSTEERKATRTFHGVPSPSDCHAELSKERKKFQVQLNVSNFSPKDVEVKVHEKYLEIHAKHGRLMDEHGIISREFTRKFEIPDDVDPETFRALFDCYGVLHVEASFKQDRSKPRKVMILLDEETRGQYNVESFEDLGTEFEELIQSYIEDGYEMAEFARNLAKQYPSDYIPIEEVIND